MNFREWCRSRGIALEGLTPEAQRNLLSEYAAAELQQVAPRGEIEAGDAAIATRRMLVPTTLDDKSRSVDAVMATETPAVVLDYRTYDLVDEVLRMDGVVLPQDDHLPLLNSHARYSVESVLGSVRGISVAGPELRGKMTFAEDPASEQAYQKVRGGHLRDVSVGYIRMTVEELAPGESKEIGGKKYTAGKRAMQVATRWAPKELSLTPIGADAAAKVRQDSRANGPSTWRESTVDFERWLSSKGLRLASLSEADVAKYRAEFEAEGKRTAPPAPAPVPASAAPAPAPAAVVPPAPVRTFDDGMTAGAAAERARAIAIRQEAQGLDIDAQIVQRALDEGQTVEQARQTFLTAVRSQRAASVGAPAIQVRSQERDSGFEALSAGLAIRAGLTPEAMERAHLGLAPGATPASRESITRWFEGGHRHRDLSLIEICREACRLDGVGIPHSKDEIIRRSISTLSLPKLFENVAHKSLIAGYAAAPNTSMAWCRALEVSDFKEHTLARMGAAADLKEVPPGGEIKHGEFSEWYQKEALRTWARRFAVTRQDIINDDLGVLGDIPAKMGAAGKRLIDDRVYTVLLANAALSDGVTLFYATTHINYVASSGALADGTLSTGRQYMRQQTDVGGSPLNIEPRFLIVPPELEHTALKLVNSQEMLKVGDDETYFGTYNVHRNKFQVITEPRLSNSSYTGYDVDAWYLAASADQCGTMAVMFLAGKREPTVEQVAVDPGYLGVGFRVYFDVEAAVEDYRGLFKSAGA